ncbi:MAG TPA: DNA repair protein RadA [Sphaerochaeta sp.]|nr:MAG: DNA repair protein RadA [Spirochaetes bacterium GWC2_52_13]OHD66955.1 MAG: DNA repair protein RadA [Spirochaetes bacterium GWF2_52_7]HCG64932.1 DNA repair protein RadA [Sphaerochaeta sp.]HCJ94472.1 DNA repair protein RadA [Sphaerochaeta sp.]HCS37943.1 DNA repair protein RadA [Sphaerochaeta sp.]
MKDLSTQYVCSQCGRVETKWLGRCPDCGSWNSFVEEVVKKQAKSGKSQLVSTPNKKQTVTLEEVELGKDFRYSCGISEFDRVLGGGIMRGGTVLLGGEPGIGKSTLMLQLLGAIEHRTVLYVSGEESPGQVRMRAQRIGVPLGSITMFNDTRLEPLLEIMRTQHPDVVVVDSLQTLSSDELPSAAGSVNQMRMCTMELVDAAKQAGTALFFIGHITKEGQIAGPKAIEHIVDTVLYFEQAGSGVRIVRAVKNRFGSVDEIGIFLMTEKGLVPVLDPAGFFISERKSGILPAGIAFTAVIEGSRTFLVEIQALTIPAKGGYSRVYSERIDTARVTRVAAVLERHAQVFFSDKDIYVNVAGGIKLGEVSIELPLALALYSAATGKPLPSTLVSMGELSLAGEVRPVGFGDKRVKGAVDMGFSTIIAPQSMPLEPIASILRCERIIDAINLISTMVPNN